MNVAILMNNFYEINVGGAEYQAYLIAKQLQKSGNKIHFIFLKNKADICLNPNKFRLCPVVKTQFLKLIPLKVIYFIPVYRQLCRVQPDIIYHRDSSSLLLLAHVYRFLNDKMVKIILHISHDKDTDNFKFLPLHGKNLLKKIDDFFRHIGLHLTSNIIAQSNHQQKMLLTNHGLKSVLIQNFCEPAGIIEYHNKENTIVWIANIKPIKNPFQFIKIANELNDTKYRFLMVGSPPPESEFKNKFYAALENANVEYLGQISNTVVNSILENAKILCCTSFEEGFSNTFLQAWVRMVPVVSLYVDPDGLINQNKLGTCSKSYQIMIKDLRRLIDNPELLKILAINSKKFAEQNYLIDRNINIFKNYVTSVLNQ